jgi:two-component system CheB/CheR fusion protein
MSRPGRAGSGETGSEAKPEATESEEAQPDAGAPEWRRLLEYLRKMRGFDFHGYKSTGLQRRVRKRMQEVGCSSFAAYQDYLEVHPDEFEALFNTILINVTGFLRDPEAWEEIRAHVIPEILRSRPSEEGVRVWSAGCASGEEAYTAAILFCEALGADEFRRRVKIYATDIDDEALAAARFATYAERQLENLTDDLKARYFERTEAGYAFRKDLRRQVIFGRHDVMQDPPISRIDLLICRNTLMYFNAETQAKILSRFHFALNERGVLFLGRAETLMTQTHAFAPVDLKRRISRKVSARARGRIARAAERDVDADRGSESQLVRGALDASPVANIIVDAAGAVVFMSERARTLFALGPADLGRPLQDLQLSYRPVELRSLIEQATSERRPALIREIEWIGPGGEKRWFDLHVAALSDIDGGSIGTAVAFTDVSVARRFRQELENANQALESAYEELQSTNEELETTNEELQSTIEELETTNEELQSTNEELETMNEELQSTNEELQTINDELRERGEQLNESNAYLESVLASLSDGVAVVDRDLRILGWNPQAEEMWGVRADEVRGQHLLTLDIGLPLQELRPAIRQCLLGEMDRIEQQVHAVNRRGRAIECRTTMSPLVGRDGAPRGLILLMQENTDSGPATEPGPHPA